MHSFSVKGFNRGTKNLARLYVGVCKADKIAFFNKKLGLVKMVVVFPYIEF